LREQYPQHGAGAAEDKALGEQGASQGTPARSECGPHGELAFAANRTRQDQVGDVRTCDDEHHDGGSKQDKQDRARRPRDLVAQPRHAQLHISRRIGLRVLVQDVGMKRAQFRTRRLQRCPGCQPPKKLRHPVSPD
jgi:hypothetical protein